MKRKIILLLMSSLMALSLVLASCGEAEEEEEEEVVITPGEEEEVIPPGEEEEEVTPPTGGNWWDYHGEPEYGGTFTWRINMDIASFDPWRSYDSTGIRNMYSDGYFGLDWTTDRAIAPLKGGYFDVNDQENMIVESWEIPDEYMTFIIHVRPGINWQDKPPMNGRELTAYDLEFTWHRMVGGLGSGFEPGSNPYTYFKGYDDFESITATDKYTLVLKTKYSVASIWTLMHGAGNAPHAREVYEQYGDLSDWKNAVGTGPFLLTDYVAGVSATFEKNPVYWGWDQRHPDKAIPYVDGAKFLIIPDQSTAFAALRTGKIFMLTGVPWEQAEAFEQSNPEIGQVPILGTGYTVAMRVDKEPFTDIRVRQALNMAIDRQPIAESYYGGRIDSTPVSYINPNMGIYFTPFEEWPKEVQEGHSYNPAKAKQLLTEAGYPDGFQTNLLISSADDMDLPQIVQGYFADIGVDMEIKVVEATTFFSFVNIFKKHEQMVWSRLACNSGPAEPTMLMHSSKFFINPCMTADPVFDELMDRAPHWLEGDPNKANFVKQADMYAMEHYWSVPILPSVSYVLYQPWLRGYSEDGFWGQHGYQFARWWIDHDLKESMGH